MKFYVIGIIFGLVPLLCFSADWPVPQSIKCNSFGTFHCKNAGRFEDPFDSTCTKYVLCSEIEEETVEVRLTCPEDTFYDPVNDVCSTDYKCLCDNDNDTAISTSTTPIASPYPVECDICSQCITATYTKNTFSSKENTPATEKLTFSTIESIIDSSQLTSSASSFSDGSLTTNNSVEYCSAGGNFTCTKTGRFANPNDSSCNSYFYCYEFSDGKLGQYKYSCSIGLFNPKKESCDPSYVCPCAVASTTETSFPQTPVTNGSTDSGVSPVITKSITEPTTATSAYCSIGGNFTCTQTGRFANSNDPECNSYFYCYVHSDGKVDQNVTPCSIGLFNPEKGRCDRSYVCPCSVANTTEATVTSSSTELPLTTVNQSVSFPYTPVTNGSSDSEISSSVITEPTTKPTTATPAYCSIGGNFTCTQTGRFANPNDPSCNSYFYCYVLSDGNVGQYVTSCSIGLFNPEKGSCDHSYVCPCSVANTTETALTSSSTELPFSTVNQSSSFPHTPSTNLSADSEISTSVITNFTTRTTTATPADCSSGINFACTQTGRFANPNDPSCNSYFYCYVHSGGKIGQYVTSCSIGLFNPEKGSCDHSYVCPCSVANTTDAALTSSFTELPLTTVDQSASFPHTSTTNGSTDSEITPSVITNFTTRPTAATPAYCSSGVNFTCTQTGRFANPNDPSCNSYFYCYVHSGGKIGQYVTSCSVGLFNPEKGSCDHSYVCPCSVANTTETAITSSSTELPFSTVNQSSSFPHTPATNGPADSEISPSVITNFTTKPTAATPAYCSSEINFTCTQTGRFANPNDPSCNSYFYCYVLSDGKVGQYVTSCSIGLFNPQKGSCDHSYVCPCSVANTTETALTSSSTELPFSTGNQSSSFPHTPSTNGSADSEISTSVITNFTTKPTAATPAYCSSGINFTCTQTGRFANPNDPSCNSYFYCYVLSDGKVGQYVTSCSIGFFNPQKGSCDHSYVCPCSVANTTETALTSSSTELPFSTGNQSSSFPHTPSTNGSADSEISTSVITNFTTKPTAATPAYCSSGINFTCTQTGRFANPNDPSCNSYFYCYVLSDGKVGQYVTSCSIGLFSPQKGSCDHSYVCPCSVANTTETALTSSSTELPFSTVNQSSSFPHTPSTNGSADSEISTSVSTNFTTKPTAATPAYCSSGINFTCTQTGRFANPNDPSCNSYFYCYVHSDGKIGQYVTSCSVGLFNPEKGSCDHSYVCPCSVAKTTETALTSSSTELPFSTDNQSSSFPHTPATNGSADSEITTSAITKSTTKPTAATPAYCSIGGNFTCTRTGRFANPNDPSCNSYFYCYVNWKGKICQYDYSCSLGLFNPEKRRCDPSYICPCSVSITTESEANHSLSSSSPTVSTASLSISTDSTTELITTTPASEPCSTNQSFTCTVTGRFANPNDKTCKSYFYCYVWANGKVRQYSYSCSRGLFNPEKQSCDLKYVCPCATS